MGRSSLVRKSDGLSGSLPRSVVRNFRETVAQGTRCTFSGRPATVVCRRGVGATENISGGDTSVEFAPLLGYGDNNGGNGWEIGDLTEESKSVLAAVCGGT